MEVVSQLMDSSNAFFAAGLKMIGLLPKHYATMFPPTVTLDYINQLVEEGVIFTLPDLAPAFTYAIILSVIRFLLQNYLIRVSFYPLFVFFSVFV